MVAVDESQTLAPANGAESSRATSDASPSSARQDPGSVRVEQRGRSARQYILSLRSAFLASLKAAPIPPPMAEGPPPEVVDELRAIFARYDGPAANWTSPTVWDDAFAAERLLVEVLDDDALEVELERRILEARDLKADALAEFYAGRKQKPSGAEGAPARLEAEQVRVNRSLLARLTRDLQWHYGQQDLKRRYSYEAQQRVVFTFLGALVVFVAVMLATFWKLPVIENGTSAPAPAAAEG